MILQADARSIPLADESVDCCVTSPPYWGLRDYGTATWEGGSPECDHSPERRGGRFATPVSGKQARNVGSGTTIKVARNLGRKGIGLELNPDYIDLAENRIKTQAGLPL